VLKHHDNKKRIQHLQSYNDYNSAWQPLQACLGMMNQGSADANGGQKLQPSITLGAMQAQHGRRMNADCGLKKQKHGKIWASNNLFGGCSTHDGSTCNAWSVHVSDACTAVQLLLRRCCS
jgi:hypothetical protein